MNKLPNIITIFRILLSPTLLFLEPFSTEFLSIYFICGFSDIVDGFIARRYNLTSKLGSVLDSIADVVLVSIMVYILLPILKIPKPIIIFIILIAVIRFASLLVVLIKYKTFAILHTYANKLTGIMLFIMPFLYKYKSIDYLGYTLCFLGIISATEELIIHVKSSNLNRDVKSIIFNSKIY